MFLMWVMVLVIDDTNEEKMTSAMMITTMLNVLSTSFSGTTSIDAGVNCVSDQCRHVVYAYIIDHWPPPKAFIAQVTPPDGFVAATRNQKHAT
mmetsp:Transcript_63340/g.145024  ORF Transcript_63340/g.145024 Transcript_63340/m.145024 type:complete len:93 (-) Transcript_63340:11-289(-)